MNTINKPVSVKDCNKESEEIIKLNQGLNNAKDDETKKKLQRI